MLSKCLKEDFLNFEKWLRFNELSDNTITSYLSDLKISIESDSTITKAMLENYSLDDFRYIFFSLQKRGVSPKSHERYFAAWRSFAKYKKQNGVVLSFSKMPSLKKKDSNYIVNIAFDDIYLFLSFFDKAETWQEKRNKSLIYLLYSVGLRINEALNLKWSDLFNKYIKIKGKGSKVRTVPLFPFVLDMLLEYKKSLNYENDYIFLSGNKIKKLHASSVARIFRNVCIHLNLKNISPHVLRHACATHLLKAGCNLRSIQALLGHSSLEITKNYINSSAEELKDDYFSLI